MEYLILIWLIGAITLFWWQYERILRPIWLEPVLRQPVLVIESDDWGPGPDAHAKQLGRLVELFSGYRDGRGRHPVMTIGVILAIPDTFSIGQNNLCRYYRLTLSDSQFSSIREAMQHGTASGVFALHLHGMEHFWPTALLSAAVTDGMVQEWLTSGKLPNTENLPSPLQTRWTNCSRLPSLPIPDHEIKSAAKEEVEAFQNLFGHIPHVAVPPTFVWNDAVEKAWYDAGVRVIVTPGQRFCGRDEEGRLQCDKPQIRNGEVGSTGITYVVRKDYFEPAFGHTSQRGLDALERNYKTARPTLLETHRFNFTRDPRTAEIAFSEMETLLKEALSRYPDLVFLSTEELAQVLREANPVFVETRIKYRVHLWLERLKHIPRVRKLAWLSGLIIPAFLVFLATSERGSVPESTTA